MRLGERDLMKNTTLREFRQRFLDEIRSLRSKEYLAVREERIRLAPAPGAPLAYAEVRASLAMAGTGMVIPCQSFCRGTDLRLNFLGQACLSLVQSALKYGCSRPAGRQ